MATITLVTGTRTSLTITNFPSAANGEFNQSSAINLTTNDPLDVLVEVTAKASTTPTGNDQVVVFAIGSLDGTNWQSAPADEDTTGEEEPDMTYLGTVPVVDTAAHRKIFSVAAAYGGVLPQQIKIVTKNDTGVALAATDCTVYYSEVTGNSA